MCRLEYKFVLVENVFMVHPGIKTPLDRNRRLRRIAAPIFQSAVALFEKRMDKCCRETKKRCPRITLIPSSRFLSKRSPHKQSSVSLAVHRRNGKMLLRN
ncbi:unnamed protein product [Toxocara canis]|nr:unnamed protein product [Toxocara canis]